MLRRIYGCSFLPHHDYGKGGRGWRDLWQDCLALLIMEPEQVRQMEQMPQLSALSRENLLLTEIILQEFGWTMVLGHI